MACLSGSHYQGRHNHTRELADFIVSWDHGDRDVVAVVEMKGGNIKATKASRQLQELATVADHELKKSAKIKFVALVVRNPRHRLRPLDMKILTRGLTFRGQRYVIRSVRCGSEIQSVAAQ